MRFQTLFSTRFFDFRVSNSQQIVSPWVWLYFIVTVGLTLLVLLAWWQYTQRSLQKQNPNQNPNKAAEMDEGGAAAHLTASLETETSIDSESMWQDQKVSVAGSPG